MDPQQRYQILGQIAEGEYATIFRARDQELGRDVAIKQIHNQYLQDPAQLERYWQEAQLLASLDHPYILTVYDIVRSRGWLILELMQGSIAQQLQGQPIDLDFLRVTLICSLHALRVLSENNVVHGDVKPGNLLLDRANRVKLGDFGIARRLTGDDGSLVKGSTKYMAPEVVSDQFGPIGTHSDLYSLGFTAYELMCGAHFDNLFPGLDMYGGNRQMAWIMWHAALDRRLPEINRVLEGVPEDLVHVIQKLTEKDPARRYRTPDEALADLRVKAQLPGAIVPATVEEEAAAAAAAAQKERSKRKLMYGVLVASMLMSVGMIFLPSGPPPKPPVTDSPQASSGILRHLDLKRNNLFLESESGEELPGGITFNPEQDRVYLDDQKVTLADLRRGDAIQVLVLKGAGGQTILEVQASRDVVTTDGAVGAVDSSLGRLDITTLESAAGPVRIDVPPTVRITINGQEQIAGRACSLSDIQKGDTASVRHVPSEGRRRATSIAVERIVPLDGTVAGIDVAQRKLSLRPAGADSSSLPKELALAENCVIAINGETSHNGQAFALSDLQVGDRVATQHHMQIVRIDVNRRLDHQGVVQSVDPRAGTLTVLLEENPNSPVTFSMAAGAEFEFGGRKEAQLDMLRPQDPVKIIHNSPDLKAPQATHITVTPAPDKQGWAIVIGEQKYEDSRLDPVRGTHHTAELVRDALLYYRRLPENQVLYLAEATKAEIEQKLPSFVEKVAAGSQLLLFYSGHAYLDGAGKPHLAPSDFQSDKMESTGIPLRWLVDELQKGAAKEKLLLLDTSHPGDSALAAREPSAAELAEAVRPRAGRPLSSSVTILAGSSKGERGGMTAMGNTTRFGAEVIQALKGPADVNDDLRIQGNELFSYIKTALTVAGVPQTPALFLPDATPDRLSDEARRGVRQLLAFLSQNQLDQPKLQMEYDKLQPLAPTQPDFKLAAGLALLKHGKPLSTQMFESALALAPQSPIAHQALAWQAMQKKDYAEGTDHLLKLLATFPVPAQKPSPYEEHIFTWSGKLSGFLQEVAASEETGSSEKVATAFAQKITTEVAKHGPAAKKLFDAGQDAVVRQKQVLVDDFKLAATDAAKNQIRFKAKLLITYVQFGWDETETALISQLEQ